MALKNDLAFYGTTLNEPDGGYRPLLRAAGAELDRLEGLMSPVTCSDCRKTIERGSDWFRCFDCKAHLCEQCVTKHFGDSYSPHHQKMENYKRTIDMLQKRIDSLRETVDQMTIREKALDN